MVTKAFMRVVKANEKGLTAQKRVKDETVPEWDRALIFPTILNLELPHTHQLHEYPSTAVRPRLSFTNVSNFRSP